MPRTGRYIESGEVYEICFRAQEGLPFVAYKCLNFIIQCVLARVQRDDKVILCHDIWNGSHPHIIVVSKDAKQLVNFYSEIQKKITDILKRLLGLEYLEIWEGACSVIKLGDLDAVIDRIAYLYANPAQDDLEDSIERFPGASSWSEFQSCFSELNSSAVKTYPWIKLPSVPKLSARIISDREDLEVIEQLNESNQERHSLLRTPNAWMKCLGIKEDSDVAAINSRILSGLRQREELARIQRKREGKSVMGAKSLRNQPILKPHKPKKKTGKIFIITTVNEIRLEFIARMKTFHAICRNCYQRWKIGEFSVKWPPAAFRPPLPPTLNLFRT